MSRVLVACEFSGIVRDAFIAAGHDAVSCDLLPSEVPTAEYAKLSQPATPARWPVRSEMPLTDAAIAEQRWQARHAGTTALSGYSKDLRVESAQPIHPEPPLTDAAYAEQRWRARHPAQPVHPEPLDVFVRETFMALRHRLVGVPPNVDSIDAIIGYALNDCEQAIVDVLFREASESEGAKE